MLAVAWSQFDKMFFLSMEALEANGFFHLLTFYLGNGLKFFKTVVNKVFRETIYAKYSFQKS